MPEKKDVRVISLADDSPENPAKETAGAKPEESTAVVPAGRVEERPGLLAIWEPTEPRRIVGTFDVAKEENLPVLLNSMQDAGSLRNELNRELTLQEVILHEVDLVDQETGEMFRTVRTVLICEEGTYSTCSEVIPRTLATIRSLYGGNMKGLRITPKQKQGKGTHVFLTLLVQGRKQPAAAAAAE